MPIRKRVQEIIEMIDYDTSGESFYGISVEELEQALFDYFFENLKVRDIKERFKIFQNVGAIRRDFPKMRKEEICKCGKGHICANLPSKVFIYEFLDLNEYFRSKGKCSSCGEKMAKEDLEKEIRDLEKESKAYQIEIDKYCLSKFDSAGPIDLNTLTLNELIMFSIVLNDFKVNDVTNSFGRFFVSDERKKYTSFEWNLIMELYVKGIIYVSNETDHSAIQLENGAMESIAFPFVKWRLNPFLSSEEIQAIKDIHLKSSSISSSEKIDTWIKIIQEELLKIINIQFKEYSIEKEKHSIYQVIDSWLTILPPSKIYSIMWWCVKQTKELNVNGREESEYIFSLNYFISSVTNEIVRRKTRKIAIPDYKYPYKVQPSRFTEYFFNNVVPLNDWFKYKPSEYTLNTASKNDSTRRIDNSPMLPILNSMLDMDVVKEDFLPSNFKSFDSLYYTPYGIVVTENNLDYLYTDKETFIRYVSNKTNTHIKSFNDALKKIKYIPNAFNIKGVYSIGYIMALIQYSSTKLS